MKSILSLRRILSFSASSNRETYLFDLAVSMLAYMTFVLLGGPSEDAQVAILLQVVKWALDVFVFWTILATCSKRLKGLRFSEWISLPIVLVLASKYDIFKAFSFLALLFLAFERKSNKPVDILDSDSKR
jgi:uncharacterized membrane protein YhaH (DUF805 family)